MLAVANQWQSEIRKPANGNKPDFTTGFGTTVTAGGSAHTKGAWTDIVVATDWSGFSGDAFEIEVNFNNLWASAADNRALADVGVDSGGGYSSVINNLVAGPAYTVSQSGAGITYRFPLHVANGVKVGVRLQCVNASATVQVGVVLRGNPSHPALVRAGTFVRTFGATTASSEGTSFTPGTASEGSWTSMATTADDLWFWDVGYTTSDTALAGGILLFDLGTGPGGSEAEILNAVSVFSVITTEGLGKPSFGRVREVASGTAMSIRCQANFVETNQTAILYAVGGSFSPASAANITGTVTIDAAAAADGAGVDIYAVDSDSVAEYVGQATIAGGSGGYSLGVPDTTRTYFARYNDGTNVGTSVNVTPGVTAADIAILTSAGGGGVSSARVVNGA